MDYEKFDRFTKENPNNEFLDKLLEDLIVGKLAKVSSSIIAGAVIFTVIAEDDLKARATAIQFGQVFDQLMDNAGFSNRHKTISGADGIADILIEMRAAARPNGELDPNFMASEVMRKHAEALAVKIEKADADPLGTESLKEKEG